MNHFYYHHVSSKIDQDCFNIFVVVPGKLSKQVKAPSNDQKLFLLIKSDLSSGTLDEIVMTKKSTLITSAYKSSHNQSNAR